MFVRVTISEEFSDATSEHSHVVSSASRRVADDLHSNVNYTYADAISLVLAAMHSLGLGGIDKSRVAMSILAEESEECYEDDEVVGLILQARKILAKKELEECQ